MSSWATNLPACLSKIIISTAVRSSSPKCLTELIDSWAAVILSCVSHKNLIGWNLVFASDPSLNPIRSQITHWLPPSFPDWGKNFAWLTGRFLWKHIYSSQLMLLSTEPLWQLYSFKGVFIIDKPQGGGERKGGVQRWP